jgi:hypothetical protein
MHQQIHHDEEAFRMANDSIDPIPETDGSPQSEPQAVGYDSYRSLLDSNLRIIVAKDVVPPFRFKSGGWEFSQSSTELGSTIKARIAERGFFMFRANEDQTGGVELTDIPPRSPGRPDIESQ